MTVLSLALPRGSISEAAFQAAMSHLASGVAVVAFWQGDRPRGLLVSRLTTLSTRPPRVLFCVGKDEPAHDALLMAEECSLNLLSEADQREAEHFSPDHPSGERFDPERWRIVSGAPPERRGALVALTGFVDQRIDAGSHSIFIVRAESADVADGPPLVFYDHGFRRLSAQA